MDDPSTYPRLLRALLKRKIHIYFQRAGFSLAEAYPRFLPIVAGAIEDDGFLATDDYYYFDSGLATGYIPNQNTDAILAQALPGRFVTIGVQNNQALEKASMAVDRHRRRFSKAAGREFNLGPFYGGQVSLRRNSGGARLADTKLALSKRREAEVREAVEVLKKRLDRKPSMREVVAMALIFGFLNSVSISFYYSQIEYYGKFWRSIAATDYSVVATIFYNWLQASFHRIPTKLSSERTDEFSKEAMGKIYHELFKTSLIWNLLRQVAIQCVLYSWDPILRACIALMTGAVVGLVVHAVNQAKLGAWIVLVTFMRGLFTPGRDSRAEELTHRDHESERSQGARLSQLQNVRRIAERSAGHIESIAREEEAARGPLKDAVRYFEAMTRMADRKYISEKRRLYKMVYLLRKALGSIYQAIPLVEEDTLNYELLKVIISDIKLAVYWVLVKSLKEIVNCVLSHEGVSAKDLLDRSERLMGLYAYLIQQTAQYGEAEGRAEFERDLDAATLDDFRHQPMPLTYAAYAANALQFYYATMAEITAGFFRRYCSEKIAELSAYFISREADGELKKKVIGHGKDKDAGPLRIAQIASGIFQTILEKDGARLAKESNGWWPGIVPSPMLNAALRIIMSATNIKAKGAIIFDLDDSLIKGELFASLRNEQTLLKHLARIIRGRVRVIIISAGNVAGINERAVRPLYDSMGRSWPVNLVVYSTYPQGLSTHRMSVSGGITRSHDEPYRKKDEIILDLIKQFKLDPKYIFYVGDGFYKVRSEEASDLCVATNPALKDINIFSVHDNRYEEYVPDEVKKEKRFLHIGTNHTATRELLRRVAWVFGSRLSGPSYVYLGVGQYYIVEDVRLKYLLPEILLDRKRGENDVAGITLGLRTLDLAKDRMKMIQKGSIVEVRFKGARLALNKALAGASRALIESTAAEDKLVKLLEFIKALHSRVSDDEVIVAMAETEFNKKVNQFLPEAMSGKPLIIRIGSLKPLIQAAGKARRKAQGSSPEDNMDGLIILCQELARRLLAGGSSFKLTPKDTDRSAVTLPSAANLVMTGGVLPETQEARPKSQSKEPGFRIAAVPSSEEITSYARTLGWPTRDNSAPEQSWTAEVENILQYRMIKTYQGHPRKEQVLADIERRAQLCRSNEGGQTEKMSRLTRFAKNRAWFGFSAVVRSVKGVSGPMAKDEYLLSFKRDHAVPGTTIPALFIAKELIEELPVSFASEFILRQIAVMEGISVPEEAWRQIYPENYAAGVETLETRVRNFLRNRAYPEGIQKLIYQLYQYVSAVMSNRYEDGDGSRQDAILIVNTALELREPYLKEQLVKPLRERGRNRGIITPLDLCDILADMGLWENIMRHFIAQSYRAFYLDDIVTSANFQAGFRFYLMIWKNYTRESSERNEASLSRWVKEEAEELVRDNRLAKERLEEQKKRLAEIEEKVRARLGNMPKLGRKHLMNAIRDQRGVEGIPAVDEAKRLMDEASQMSLDLLISPYQSEALSMRERIDTLLNYGENTISRIKAIAYGSKPAEGERRSSGSLEGALRDVEGVDPRALSAQTQPKKRDEKVETFKASLTSPGRELSFEASDYEWLADFVESTETNWHTPITESQAHRNNEVLLFRANQASSGWLKAHGPFRSLYAITVAMTEDRVGGISLTEVILMNLAENMASAYETGQVPNFMALYRLFGVINSFLFRVRLPNETDLNVDSHRWRSPQLQSTIESSSIRLQVKAASIEAAVDSAKEKAMALLKPGNVSEERLNQALVEIRHVRDAVSAIPDQSSLPEGMQVEWLKLMRENLLEELRDLERAFSRSQTELNERKRAAEDAERDRLAEALTGDRIDRILTGDLALSRRARGEKEVKDPGGLSLGDEHEISHRRLGRDSHPKDRRSKSAKPKRGYADGRGARLASQPLSDAQWDEMMAIADRLARQILKTTDKINTFGNENFNAGRSYKAVRSRLIRNKYILQEIVTEEKAKGQTLTPEGHLRIENQLNIIYYYARLFFSAELSIFGRDSASVLRYSVADFVVYRKRSEGDEMDQGFKAIAAILSEAYRLIDKMADIQSETAGSRLAAQKTAKIELYYPVNNQWDLRIFFEYYRINSTQLFIKWKPDPARKNGRLIANPDEVSAYIKKSNPTLDVTVGEKNIIISFWVGEELVEKIKRDMGQHASRLKLSDGTKMNIRVTPSAVDRTSLNEFLITVNTMIIKAPYAWKVGDKITLPGSRKVTLEVIQRQDEDRAHQERVYHMSIESGSKNIGYVHFEIIFPDIYFSVPTLREGYRIGFVEHAVSEADQTLVDQIIKTWLKAQFPEDVRLNGARLAAPRLSPARSVTSLQATALRRHALAIAEIYRDVRAHSNLKAITEDKPDKSPATLADYLSQIKTALFLHEHFYWDGLVMEEEIDLEKLRGWLRAVPELEKKHSRQIDAYEKIQRWVANRVRTAHQTKFFWALDPLDGTLNFIDPTSKTFAYLLARYKKEKRKPYLFDHAIVYGPMYETTFRSKKIKGPLLQIYQNNGRPEYDLWQTAIQGTLVKVDDHIKATPSRHRDISQGKIWILDSIYGLDVPLEIKLRTLFRSDQIWVRRSTGLALTELLLGNVQLVASWGHPWDVAPFIPLLWSFRFDSKGRYQFFPYKDIKKSTTEDVHIPFVATRGGIYGSFVEREIRKVEGARLSQTTKLEAGSLTPDKAVIQPPASGLWLQSSPRGHSPVFQEMSGARLATSSFIYLGAGEYYVTEDIVLGKLLSWISYSVNRRVADLESVRSNIVSALDQVGDRARVIQKGSVIEVRFKGARLAGLYEADGRRQTADGRRKFLPLSAFRRLPAKGARLADTIATPEAVSSVLPLSKDTDIWTWPDTRWVLQEGSESSRFVGRVRAHKNFIDKEAYILSPRFFKYEPGYSGEGVNLMDCLGRASDISLRKKRRNKDWGVLIDARGSLNYFFRLGMKGEKRFLWNEFNDIDVHIILIPRGEFMADMNRHALERLEEFYEDIKEDILKDFVILARKQGLVVEVRGRRVRLFRKQTSSMGGIRLDNHISPIQALSNAEDQGVYLPAHNYFAYLDGQSAQFLIRDSNQSDFKAKAKQAIRTRYQVGYQYLLMAKARLESGVSLLPHERHDILKAIQKSARIPLLLGRNLKTHQATIRWIVDQNRWEDKPWTPRQKRTLLRRLNTILRWYYPLRNDSRKIAGLLPVTKALANYLSGSAPAVDRRPLKRPISIDFYRAHQMDFIEVFNEHVFWPSPGSVQAEKLQLAKEVDDEFRKIRQKDIAKEYHRAYLELIKAKIWVDGKVWTNSEFKQVVKGMRGALILDRCLGITEDYEALLQFVALLSIFQRQIIFLGTLGMVSALEWAYLRANVQELLRRYHPSHPSVSKKIGACHFAQPLLQYAIDDVDVGLHPLGARLVRQKTGRQAAAAIAFLPKDEPAFFMAGASPAAPYDHKGDFKGARLANHDRNLSQMTFDELRALCPSNLMRKHMGRVHDYAMLTARRLGLRDELVQLLGRVALVHDFNGYDVPLKDIRKTSGHYKMLLEKYGFSPIVSREDYWIQIEAAIQREPGLAEFKKEGGEFYRVLASIIKYKADQDGLECDLELMRDFISHEYHSIDHLTQMGILLNPVEKFLIGHHLFYPTDREAFNIPGATAGISPEELKLLLDILIFCDVFETGNNAEKLLYTKEIQYQSLEDTFRIFDRFFGPKGVGDAPKLAMRELLSEPDGNPDKQKLLAILNAGRPVDSSDAIKAGEFEVSKVARLTKNSEQWRRLPGSKVFVTRLTFSRKQLHEIWAKFGKQKKVHLWKYLENILKPYAETMADTLVETFPNKRRRRTFIHSLQESWVHAVENSIDSLYQQWEEDHIEKPLIIDFWIRDRRDQGFVDLILVSNGMAKFYANATYHKQEARGQGKFRFGGMKLGFAQIKRWVHGFIDPEATIFLADRRKWVGDQDGALLVIRLKEESLKYSLLSSLRKEFSLKRSNNGARLASDVRLAKGENISRPFNAAMGDAGGCPIMPAGALQRQARAEEPSLFTEKSPWIPAKSIVGMKRLLFGLSTAWGAQALDDKELPIMLGDNDYVFKLSSDGKTLKARAPEGILLEIDISLRSQSGVRSQKRSLADQLTVQDLRRLTEAARQKIDEALRSVEISTDKPLVVDINLDFLANPSFSFYLDELLLELSSLRARSYAKNVIFVVSGRSDLVEQALEHPKAKGLLYSTVPNEFKSAQTVYMTLAQNPSHLGAINLPVKSIEEGDIPGFISLIQVSIYSGRIDSANIPEGFIRAVTILMGERPDAVTLKQILEGLADLKTRMRFALKPIQRVALDKLMQFFRMSKKWAEQAA